jgi:L-ascorbate metabolism protein UlaG (beta-lactamase superfamily)
MRIHKLGWAGIELESASGQTAVIDLIEDLGSLKHYVGDPHEPLPPARPGAVLALVTHLHDDHADAAAIDRVLAPDGVVLRPPDATGEFLEVAAVQPNEQALAGARIVHPWESVTAGPFTATAVPAVDGFGDPQVSWIVEADGVRIFHGGDTLFHGYWWKIAMRHGPIDVAFLPCNAPVCDWPHRQPASRLGAVMDPVQAATAAQLLQARLAVPIHYGTIHRPPVYVEVDDAGAAFERAATTPVQVVAPGEEVDLSAVLAVR